MKNLILLVLVIAMFNMVSSKHVGNFLKTVKKGIKTVTNTLNNPTVKGVIGVVAPALQQAYKDVKNKP